MKRSSLNLIACFLSIFFIICCLGGCTSGGDDSSSDTSDTSTETVSFLAVGARHACALTTAGRIFCWGYNGSGELGDGTTAESGVGSFPVQEATFSKDWSSVAPKQTSTCALKTNGALWCWGKGIATTPQEFGDRTDWSEVHAANSHTCALTVSDELYCWGDNFYGQLGIGDNDFGVQLEPMQEISESNNWKTASAGIGKSTCAIKDDGSLWCWGYNHYGQLGDGTNTDRYVPTRIGNATHWQSVSVGGNHTCALTQGGDLWCWGRNSDGQLGDDSTVDTDEPKLIDAGNNWMHVSAGYASTCGITDDGKLWCWGNNYNGRLGDGTTTDRHVPTRIGDQSDWMRVELGNDSFACGLRGNGAVYCWGYNSNGQLGDGTTENRDIPTPVAF